MSTFYAIGMNAMMFPTSCTLTVQRLAIEGAESNHIRSILEATSLIPHSKAGEVLTNMDNWLVDTYVENGHVTDQSEMDSLPEITTGDHTRLRVGDVVYILTSFFTNTRNEVKNVAVTRVIVGAVR